MIRVHAVALELGIGGELDFFGNLLIYIKVVIVVWVHLFKNLIVLFQHSLPFRLILHHVYFCGRVWSAHLMISIMDLEDVETAHVVFVYLCELVEGHVWILFALVF